MSFEHVDVQWTVVCKISPKALIDRIVGRAQDLGWSLEKLTITDLEGNSIPRGMPSPPGGGLDDRGWPAETLGSAECSRSNAAKKHVLFWSTYYGGRIGKIAGGLYLGQYAKPGDSFERACKSALSDLRQLIVGDDVLCIVLALEDDEGIDLAPGIAGLYRPQVWSMVPETSLEDVTADVSGDWIEVHPFFFQTIDSREDSSADERTTATILCIQSALENLFWGHADEEKNARG